MAADDFTIDFTDYKDTQGDYVPPGHYTCIIEDAETGVSTQKQTPQLTLWLRVVGGDYDGLTLVENLYLTKPSRFRFASFLKALNLKVPKGRAPFKARSFLNRRINVLTEDNEYKNKIRTRVAEWERYVAPGSQVAANEVDPEELTDGTDEFGAGTDESLVDFPDAPDEEYTGEYEGEGEEEDALATGPGDEIPAPTTEEEVTAEAAPKAQAPAAAPKAEAPAASPTPAAAAPKTEAPSAPAEEESLEDEVSAALAEDEFADEGDTGPDGSEVAVVGSDDDEDDESMELEDLEDLEV